jgi:hypothetical protein
MYKWGCVYMYLVEAKFGYLFGCILNSEDYFCYKYIFLSLELASNLYRDKSFEKRILTC